MSISLKTSVKYWLPGLKGWTAHSLILLARAIAACSTERRLPPSISGAEVSHAADVCARLSADLDLPEERNDHFLLACTDNLGLPLSSVNSTTRAGKLSRLETLLLEDKSVWGSAFEAEDLAKLSRRLNPQNPDTRVLQRDGRAILERCRNVECIRAEFASRSESRLASIAEHISAFPMTIVATAEFQCSSAFKQTSAAPLKVILHREGDELIGTVDGLTCGLPHLMEVTGRLTSNIALVQYTDESNFTRHAVLVVRDEILYWQETEIEAPIITRAEDDRRFTIFFGMDAPLQSEPLRCILESPISVGDFRPSIVAHCDYDSNELLARLLRLTATIDAPFSVETVERAFGLPALASYYSSNSNAGYSVSVGAEGGLRFSVSIHEHGPTFSPGVRPMRQHDIEFAELGIDATYTSDERGGSVTPMNPCLTMAAVEAHMLSEGWREKQEENSLDSRIIDISFEHDRKTVFIELNNESCVYGLRMRQRPDLSKLGLGRLQG